MDLLQEFNKKYLGQSDYDPTAASLSKSFYDEYLSLSAVGNDIRPTTASPWPPSPLDLLRSSFGKPSANHSFVQDACFETSFVLVLKSGLFEPADILALHRCHPLLSHLLCVLAYTSAATTFSGSPGTTLTGTSSSHWTTIKLTHSLCASSTIT
jgi:hypothetical protein